MAQEAQHAQDALVRIAVTRLLVVALLADGMTPLMPFIAHGLGISISHSLLLLGGCQLAMALTQALAAPGLDRFGAWRAGSLACLALGVLAALSSLAVTPLQLALLLAVTYVVHGLGVEAMRAALREVLNGPAMGQALALAARAAEWLQLAIPLTVTWMVVQVGWRGALLILAVPACAVGVWMLSGWRVAHVPVPNTPRRRNWRALLARPAFYLPTALAAAYQLCCAPVLLGLPFLLEARMEMAPLAMGIWLSMAHALCLAAQVLAGWMLMRRSMRDAVRVGILLMAASLVAMLGAPWMGMVLYSAGCMLVLVAGGFIMLPCLLEAMKAPERAAAGRLFALAQMAAGALGLMAMGSGILAFLPGLAAMTAISLVLMAWLRPESLRAAA